MRKTQQAVIKLEKIVPGGQSLGRLENGKKVFVWGALPDEIVLIEITKNRSSHAEGRAIEIIESSPERIEPIDTESYISTSPWQIMNFEFEQKHKNEIISEAFRQNKIDLTSQEDFFSDYNIYNYRNKVEFSFWWEKSEVDPENGELNLAFFRRGGQGKIPVLSTSLAKDSINRAGKTVLSILKNRGTSARDLKTLLIRSSADDNISAQLYVKSVDFEIFSADEIAKFNFLNFQIIYSDPLSPASVITKMLQNSSHKTLSDKILNIDFKYATESFFQINIPVYEQALRDMEKFIDNEKPSVDLYSGVGTIGLTICKNELTMIEINPATVEEMSENITKLKRENSVKAILSASEKALDFILTDANLIVDPPRAGMDKKVCAEIIKKAPKKIIYLSCNPITQARDAAILNEKYRIIYSRGYNFFPRTPHIENLIVLELK